MAVPFRLKIIFFFGTILYPVSSWTQEVFNYANFSEQLQFINPAFSGIETKALLSTRNQWMSIDNAPQTTSFAVSSPLKNNLGVGLNVLSNSMFVQSRTIASADVSYKLTINDQSQIYLGLRGGGYFYRADPLSLSTSSQLTDPSQQVQASFAPVIGAGLYWTFNDFWLSYSVPQLVKLGSLDRTINSVINIQHYAAAGFNYNLTENFQLKNALILRKSENFDATQQYSSSLSYQDLIELGATYYSSGNGALIGQLNISNLFSLGYAYEKALSSQTSGLDRRTHEVFISVNLDSILGKSPEVEQDEEVETNQQ